MTLTAVGVVCAAGQAVVTVLYASQAAPYLQVSAGFRRALEARDIAVLMYERTLAGESPVAFAQHVALKQPHVVLALGSRAAQFCRDSATSPPVVFAMVLDAEGLAGSGRTGVTLQIPADIRLKTVLQVLPRLKTVACIAGPGSGRELEELSRECAARGLALVSRTVKDHTQFATAFNSVSAGAGCFVMVPDPAVYTPPSVEYLLRSSLDARVPVIGISSLYVKAGALMAFDCDYADIGRQAAVIATRVIAGERAESVAVQTPQSTSFSVNLAVAQRLGITIPASLLDSASSVFGR